jgi:methionyl-tRNA formyltransferase
VAVSSGAGAAPAGWRAFDFALVADDRVGIVADLTRLLADRGVTIERLNTATSRGDGSQVARFKVDAHVLVPAQVDLEGLRAELGALARSLTGDLQLGERGALP